MQKFLFNGQTRYKTITPRLRQVLVGIASNQSHKMIANELGISVKTVETHRQILAKVINCHSTCEFVHYALHHKLVENIFAADNRLLTDR